MKTLGERIRRMREERGWTQTELGKKLGVSGTTITRYEKGLRHPDPEGLTKLADVFDCSIDHLLGRESPKQANIGADHFGERLMQLREDRNMTQKELAKVTGLSQSYIARLERHHAPPSEETLKRLAKGLGIEVDELKTKTLENRFEDKTTDIDEEELLDSLSRLIAHGGEELSEKDIRLILQLVRKK